MNRMNTKDKKYYKGRTEEEYINKIIELENIIIKRNKKINELSDKYENKQIIFLDTINS